VTITSLTRRPARHWRVLNWLFECVMAGQPSPVATAIAEQAVTPPDLVHLEQSRLIQVRLGQTTISFAEQFGDRITPTAAMMQTTVRLTRIGSDLLHYNDHNKVIRSMYWLKPCRDIWSVKHEIQVDDATLKELDDSRLIESVDPRVPLRGFRKLPDELKIRLTQKGRGYAPRGTPGSA
jgi:hypothetical protein